MTDEGTHSANIRRNSDDTIGADDRNNNNFQKRKCAQLTGLAVDNLCGPDANNRNQLDCVNEVKKPQQQQQQVQQHHSKSDPEPAKNSAQINFSVDRILDTNSNGHHVWNNVNLTDMRMCTGTNYLHSNDEFNRLCRPMPIRCFPNASHFAGKLMLYFNRIRRGSEEEMICDIVMMSCARETIS